MTYWMTLALTLAYGCALGILYFGGLWYTVRRARHTHRTNRLLIGSFVIRAIGALAGFYLLVVLIGPQWEPLALGLVGFVSGRQLLIRRLRPHTVPPPVPSNGTGHGD